MVVGFDEGMRRLDMGEDDEEEGDEDDEDNSDMVGDGIDDELVGEVNVNEDNDCAELMPLSLTV